MKRHGSPTRRPGINAATTRRPESPYRSRYPLLAGLLLLALSMTAYLPATRCGTIWDDDFHVLNNETLRSTDGLGRIWFEIGSTPQYYPLTHTSFWLEYHAWGLWLPGYHLVNILLHALGVLLLWRVLRLLGVPAAWWVAAIFALHPVHVESVAWISERKNVLSCVFYLAAAWAWCLFAQLPETDPGPPRFNKWYLVSLMCFLCALWSKTVTCTLPAALLLVLWWKRGRIGWRNVAALIPFFISGLAFGLITISREQKLGAVGPNWDFSYVERWLIAGRALCFHAGKILWPHHLTFIYPRWQVNAGLWWQYIFPTTVITLILVLWRLRRRVGRGPVTALLFFAGTLVPALGFFDVYPMRYTFVADHYQHLASLGLISLLVALAVRATRRWGGAGKALGLSAGLIVLATFATLTWRQQAAYRNPETLWRDTLRKNPQAWMAHNHLGNILLAQNKPDEAIRFYRETLRIKPDHADAHNNWGNALASQKEYGEAIRHYQAALKIEPDSVRVLGNLANALASSGRSAEAIDHYRRALSLHPRYADAHYNLGLVLQRHGNLAESIEHYQQAVRIRPDYAAAHNRLAAALIESGHIGDAFSHYREAVRLKPDWPAPMNDLAWILATHPDPEVRQPDEAIRLAEYAAELTRHRNMNVLDTLAAAFAAAGRYDQAVSTAGRALAVATNAASGPIVNQIEKRLDLYRRGRAYHESPGKEHRRSSIVLGD